MKGVGLQPSSQSRNNAEDRKSKTRTGGQGAIPEVKHSDQHIRAHIPTLAPCKGTSPLETSEAQRVTDLNTCDGSTIRVMEEGLVILCHLQGMSPFIWARRIKVSMYLQITELLKRGIQIG